MLLTVMGRTRAELDRRVKALEHRLEYSECVDGIHREPVGLLKHRTPTSSMPVSTSALRTASRSRRSAATPAPRRGKGMGTPWILGLWRTVRPGRVRARLSRRGRRAAGGAGRAVRPQRLVHGRAQDAAAHGQVPPSTCEERAEREVDRNGAGANGRDDAVEQEALSLGARIVGRWQDGRSLVMSQDPHPRNVDHRATAFPERINRFRYSQDSDGYGCPLGCTRAAREPARRPRPQVQVARQADQAPPHHQARHAVSGSDRDGSGGRGPTEASGG